VFPVRRLAGRVWAVPIVVVSVLLGACTAGDPEADPGGSTSSPATTIAESTWDLVILSDSTLAAVGETVAGVGERYAEHIEETNDVTVVLHDKWRGGLSAQTLLIFLTDGDNPVGSELQELVREAEVVVYAANYWGLQAEEQDWACGAEGPQYFVNSCEREGFAPYQQALEQIAARIKELRNGQPTILRTVDYAVPGVHNWRDLGVYDACLACFGHVNDAIWAAAAVEGIPVARVWQEFNGPDGSEDAVAKGYFPHYGAVHPSDKGTQAIADLLHEHGYESTI
jgi:hypothetical protein